MKAILEKDLSSKGSSLSNEIRPKPKATGKSEHITADQIDEIMYVCIHHDHVLENMLHALRLTGVEYMPRADYRKNIERLRKIINASKEATSQ